MSVQPSVDQLIQERKRQQRASVRRRWILRALFSGWILVIGLTGYGLYQSSLIRPGSVVWVGETLLSPAELRKTAGFDDLDWSVLTDPVTLQKALADHPLIASVSVKRQSQNSFRITLTERRLVGLLLSPEGQQYVIETGSLTPATPTLVQQNLALPLIYDLINPDDLSHLAAELVALDDEIFVNISEIHRVETGYSQLTLVLHMQDGNRVYVAISALFRLSDYLRVIQNTGLTNACFELIETGDAVPVITCPQD